MKLYLGSPQLERRFRLCGTECSRLLRKTAAPALSRGRPWPSTELQQVTQSLRTRKKEAVRPSHPSEAADSPPPLLLSTIRSSSSSRAQGQRRQKMRLSRRKRSIRMKRVGTTVCKKVECEYCKWQFDV